VLFKVIAYVIYRISTMDSLLVTGDRFEKFRQRRGLPLFSYGRDLLPIPSRLLRPNDFVTKKDGKCLFESRK
jgi:hypothetical protein